MTMNVTRDDGGSEVSRAEVRDVDVLAIERQRLREETLQWIADSAVSKLQIAWNS
jgi:hypothetical protein